MPTCERGDRRVTIGYCPIVLIEVLNTLLMRLDRLDNRA
jgi:hypothetical protein